MHLAHWQLERSPFVGSLDVGQFYPSPGHDEALARLEYLVEAGKRLGALVGEPGVGKSLVLHVASRRLARKGCALVVIDALGIGTRELLWQLAAGLGDAPPREADVPRLWRTVTDRLVENRLRKVSTVLLVDDLVDVRSDVLMQVARLVRLEGSNESRWTIVLAAEPAHAAHWDDSLRELVDLRIDVGPWRMEDTIGFVQTALVEAGRFDPVFDDGALAALHDLSGGNPRQAIRLADFALLAGASAKVGLIDAALVHAAAEELAWPTARAYAAI